MRVLITSQVFPPEIHPTARIVRELAGSLSDAGHQVTVVTGYPNHPHGRVLDGYAKKWILRERIDGVSVIRGWHLTSSAQSVPIRAVLFLSQAVGIAIAGWTAGRSDVVINFGPPLAGPVLSALLSGARRARLISVIYDLYPDVAIDSGVVRNRAVIWLAKALERWIYRTSDRIVVLSEGFRRALVDGKGVPGEKIRVITVWLDTNELRRPSILGDWRAAQGIPEDTFLVIYAGTIGLVSGAEVMAEVAREFAEDRGVLFLFVGEGKNKDAVRERTTGLRNIRFLDFQPREHVAAMLSSADIGVMTLLPGRGRTSVPSKVLAYMAVELPVLAGCDADSDSARMVREAGCGMVVPPSDAAAISDAIRDFRADPDARREAGKRGRAYLERFHSMEEGTKDFRFLIEELGGSGAGSESLPEPGKMTSVPAWERGVAAFILSLLSPLLLMLAGWTKLVSPGPALFWSDRIGRDGKIFRLCKLRTMVPGAPQILTDDLRTVAAKDDERLIPGGRFLRRGFDEIFQLWNVVRGEMRLVGPRPDLAWMRGKYLPAARPRLSVAPGITGWAQIHGSRGDLSTRERYLLDLWYVEHRSGWLDLKILLWTPLYMLTGIGPGKRGRGRCIAELSGIGPLFIGDVNGSGGG